MGRHLVELRSKKVSVKVQILPDDYDPSAVSTAHS